MFQLGGKIKKQKKREFLMYNNSIYQIFWSTLILWDSPIQNQFQPVHQLPYNVSVTVHWLIHSEATMPDLCKPLPGLDHRPPDIAEQSSDRSPVYNQHCTV